MLVEPSARYVAMPYPPRRPEGRNTPFIPQATSASCRKRKATCKNTAAIPRNTQRCWQASNGTNYSGRILLRRDLPDSAAQYLAANLRDTFFGLSIVLDEGEEEDKLLLKESAMELPPSAHPEKSGLGFWGVVFAVIVALLILSIF